MVLRIGQAAPPFETVSDDGQRLSLAALRGQWVVLYFFRRALSPGCSLQARQFEQALGEFRQLGAQVIGVSSDTEARQALFRETCQLHFPLLPDSERQIGKAYGAAGGPWNWPGTGRRCTYLITPQGQVAQVWRRVNPAQHAAKVLRELSRQRALGGA
ncbi:peroxiredoxin [Deinococcus irradiatisoli]|uniref:thioredoxin-dependent peroxiredoxin n=1 Tax=Deinococcus irradiatisoli TaxID=2202254 RepID=A0A2Z3JP67_9DEIO|nr:peroxiredoxin [Deinococcus irradiatisoli]AWN22934.1 peroxiredoxin [Deinococcus irradiatisoli]